MVAGCVGKSAVFLVQQIVLAVQLTIPSQEAVHHQVETLADFLRKRLRELLDLRGCDWSCAGEETCIRRCLLRSTRPVVDLD